MTIVTGVRVAQGAHVSHDRAHAHNRAPPADLEDLFVAVLADDCVMVLLRCWIGCGVVCCACRRDGRCHGCDGSIAQIRLALSPVHPVWCEAPSPQPVSPLKYSWKSSC